MVIRRLDAVLESTKQGVSMLDPLPGDHRRRRKLLVEIASRHL
jgi:hypothetical protein